MKTNCSRINLSFSDSVFCPLGNLSAIFIEFELSSANIFSLEESKICCLRKSLELTHYIGEQNYNRVAKRNEGAYDNLKCVLKWEKE